MEASSDDMEEPLLPRTAGEEPGGGLSSAGDNDESDVQNELRRRSLSPIPHILEDNDEEDASQGDAPDGMGLEDALIRFFGRPYGLDAMFWFQVLPACLVLGGLVGLMEIGVLWIDHLVFEVKTDGRYQIWWLVLLVGGFAGLLSGIIRAAWPDIPRFDHLFQGSLDGNSIQSYISLVLVSLIALLSFVPIGKFGSKCSETLNLLMVMAALISYGLNFLMKRCPTGPELTIGTSAMLLPLMAGKLLELDTRVTALLVKSALAAAMGCLFSSPLVGIVLVYELTLMFHLQSQSNRNAIAFPPHDVFETLSMSGASSVTAVIVHRYVLPRSLRAAAVRFDLGNDFEAWHWPQAIILGALGGLIGYISLMTYGFFTKFRLGVGLSKWFDRTLFSTAGGVVCGLLYILSPQGSMSQVEFLSTNAAAARSGGEFLSAEELFLVAGSRILGLAFSLGFGLVGGHILPVAVIGACVGLAVSSPLIPLPLAVPTFIASSAVSVFPIPFTVVVATGSAIALNPNQVVSVVIAVLVAQAFINGFGVIKNVFEPHGFSVDDGSSAIVEDDEEIIFEQEPQPLRESDFPAETEAAEEDVQEQEHSQMEP